MEGTVFLPLELLAIPTRTQSAPMSPSSIVLNQNVFDTTQTEQFTRTSALCCHCFGRTAFLLSHDPRVKGEGLVRPVQVPGTGQHDGLPSHVLHVLTACVLSEYTPRFQCHNNTTHPYFRLSAVRSPVACRCVVVLCAGYTVARILAEKRSVYPRRTSTRNGCIFRMSSNYMT